MANEVWITQDGPDDLAATAAGLVRDAALAAEQRAAATATYAGSVHGGGAACARCRELAGTVWPVGQGPVPPLHPNCHCARAPFVGELGLDDWERLRGWVGADQLPPRPATPGGYPPAVASLGPPATVTAPPGTRDGWWEEDGMLWTTAGGFRSLIGPASNARQVIGPGERMGAGGKIERQGWTVDDLGALLRLVGR